MIDEALISAAKRDIEKLTREKMMAQLCEEDRELMRKYPKHTLAAAKLIDATPVNPPVAGYTSGFEKIVAQERGNCHLSGDHT